MTKHIVLPVNGGVAHLRCRCTTPDAWPCPRPFRWVDPKRRTQAAPPDWPSLLALSQGMVPCTPIRPCTFRDLSCAQAMINERSACMTRRLLRPIHTSTADANPNSAGELRTDAQAGSLTGGPEGIPTRDHHPLLDTAVCAVSRDGTAQLLRLLMLLLRRESLPLTIACSVLVIWHIARVALLQNVVATLKTYSPVLLLLLPSL